MQDLRSSDVHCCKFCSEVFTCLNDWIDHILICRSSMGIDRTKLQEHTTFIVTTPPPVMTVPFVNTPIVPTTTAFSPITILNTTPVSPPVRHIVVNQNINVNITQTNFPVTLMAAPHQAQSITLQQQALHPENLNIQIAPIPVVMQGNSVPPFANSGNKNVPQSMPILAVPKGPTSVQQYHGAAGCSVSNNTSLPAQINSRNVQAAAPHQANRSPIQQQALQPVKFNMQIAPKPVPLKFNMQIAPKPLPPLANSSNQNVLQSKQSLGVQKCPTSVQQNHGAAGCSVSNNASLPAQSNLINVQAATPHQANSSPIQQALQPVNLNMQIAPKPVPTLANSSNQNVLHSLAVQNGPTSVQQNHGAASCSASNSTSLPTEINLRNVPLVTRMPEEPNRSIPAMQRSASDGYPHQERQQDSNVCTNAQTSVLLPGSLQVPSGLSTQAQEKSAENENSFLNWMEWAEKWKKVKSWNAAEKIRLNPNLFRCMSYDCSYSTMNSSEFVSHLLKDHPGESITCSYCLRSSFSAESLASHSEEHKSWLYQCPHCVYRASTPAHVLMHWRALHSDSKVEKVWKLPWPTMINIPEELTDGHIEPYLCKECSFETRSVSEFGFHQSVHPSLSCFRCTFVTPSFNSLLLHLRDHGIYEFHCYFCKYAAASLEAVFEHICINHPGKPLQICSRVEVEIQENEIHRSSDSERKDQNQTSQLDNIENDPALLRRLGKSTSKSKPHHNSKSSGESTNGKQTVEKGKVVPSPNVDNNEGMGKIPCSDCEKLFTSRKDLLNHVMFYHNRTNVDFCATSPSENLDKRKFKKRSANKGHHSSGKTKPVSSGIKYLCVFCDYMSDNIVKMDDHLYLEVTGDVIKHKQTRIKKIEKWISEYLKAQEPDEAQKFQRFRPNRVRKNLDSNTKCPLCSSEVHSTINVMMHLARHLQYKPYSCRHCPREFHTYTVAIKHAKDHSEENQPFDCFPSTYINTWMKKLVYGDDPRLWPIVLCCLCEFRDREVSVVVKHFAEAHPGKPLYIKSDMPSAASKSELLTVPAYGGSIETTPNIGLPNDQDIEQNVDTVRISPENLSQQSPSANFSCDTIPLQIFQSLGAVNMTQQLTKNDSTKTVLTSEYDKNTHSVVAQAPVSKDPFSEGNVPEPNNVSDCSDTDVDADLSESANTDLKCSICLFSTKDLDTFKNHCKSEHSMKGSKRKRKLDLPNSELKDKCSKVSKPEIATTSNADVQTFNIVTPIRCPLCRYWTTSATKLSVHTKKKHPSGTRKPIRPLSSDDEDESVEMGQGSDCGHVKASSSTEDDKKIDISGTRENQYFSNYGKKPEPIDFDRLCIAVQNPGGSDVRLALRYYKDIWFRKEIRIRLQKCLSQFY